LTMPKTHRNRDCQFWPDHESCNSCIHMDTDDGACEYCIHGPAIECHFEEE